MIFVLESNPFWKDFSFTKENWKQGCHGQEKNVWKMKFFPGPEKVREFGVLPRKFRKDLESQGILK